MNSIYSSYYRFPCGNSTPISPAKAGASLREAKQAAAQQQNNLHSKGIKGGYGTEIHSAIGIFKKFVFGVFLFGIFQLLLAAEPIYPFKYGYDEQKFISLTKEMRCTVCQNQSLFDSMAPLAVDMRDHIYEMVGSGESENAIVNFMQERYGPYILYKPPFKLQTFILWLGPILLFLIGGYFFWRNIKGED